MRRLLLIACLAAPAALAAPRIDTLVVKPNPATFSGGKPPEVEVTVSVKRGQFDSGGCEVALDLGDGSRPRTVEFGLATAKTTKHVYKKDGSYKVTAKGGGNAACEGMREATLTVKGAPAAAKVPEPKKAEPAKKKPAAKKKPEPKKKGAEAPSS
jgi:PKD repeat protein